ncbi:MAG TPA: SLBB domain-containing protein [Urbifossiella sp.]|jgi:protein involved in polysaccharide export with SLBB domain|nr:SLBB domain-containing protein [Urbifossiella sp.]
MRLPTRRAGAVLVWALGVAAVGCESLGLSPPANQLLPATKDIRNSAPVPAPVPRELAKELHSAYVVEPGDVLLVQPADLDAPLRLPPDQTVFADGTIDLGVYGRPVVAGKGLAQIETEVKNLVAAKEKTKEQFAVTVRLIGRNSKVYYVLGEVNAPGAFPITGREAVLDGIIAAGGITKRASEQNVVLSRPTPPDGCRVVYPVCYTNIVQLGDTTTNYQIQPGDRIYVPGKGLFEGILPQRCAKNGPCARPQVACWWGGNCGPTGCPTPAADAAPAGPVLAPVPAPAPR